MFQNLHDLAELAKAGYKPNDIKELLELSKLEPEKAADNSGNDQKDPDAYIKIKASAVPDEDQPDPIEAIIKRNEGE